MGTKLFTYELIKLIEEDIKWLLSQPRTLERDHIEEILQDTIKGLK